MADWVLGSGPHLWLIDRWAGLYPGLVHNPGEERLKGGSGVLSELDIKKRLNLSRNYVTLNKGLKARLLSGSRVGKDNLPVRFLFFSRGEK
jgi:hypothetical protein